MSTRQRLLVVGLFSLAGVVSSAINFLLHRYQNEIFGIILDLGGTWFFHLLRFLGESRPPIPILIALLIYTTVFACLAGLAGLMARKMSRTPHLTIAGVWRLAPAILLLAFSSLLVVLPLIPIGWLVDSSRLDGLFAFLDHVVDRHSWLESALTLFLFAMVFLWFGIAKVSCWALAVRVCLGFRPRHLVWTVLAVGSTTGLLMWVGGEFGSYYWPYPMHVKFAIVEGPILGSVLGFWIVGKASGSHGNQASPWAAAEAA